LDSLRVAVIGAGAFGNNHLRVLHHLPDVVVSAVVDSNPTRGAEAAAKYGCPALCSSTQLNRNNTDAAIVAVPTVQHATVACELLDGGIDVLVEKPIAPDLESAKRIVEIAKRTQSIVQVGHLERFNPAIRALQDAITLPLFFEIHRMSAFTPRSLDVDVVLDLMIHDIDIVLALVGAMPQEIRAAGISILSEKVDIANVRLAFHSGCVANLTASRMSFEKIRKLRVFQPGQYISVDYQRQDAAVVSVSGQQQIGFNSLPVQKEEPLKLELESFLHCVRTRQRPVVTAEDAMKSLEVALSILDSIDKHTETVAATLEAHGATARA
jgi:predicted dehydrogenase